MSRKEESAPSSFTGVDYVSGQSKQAASEVSRRARRSAAVIGLALSVGAHGLVLTRPGDAATVADPMASKSSSNSPNPATDGSLSESEDGVVTIPALEPSLSAKALVLPAEAVAVSTPATDASNAIPVVSLVRPDVDASASAGEAGVILHSVREGQTLWKIARVYGVDETAIALANGLSTHSTLMVGQVLKVPVSSRTASVAQADADSLPADVSVASLAAEVSQSSAPTVVDGDENLSESPAVVPTSEHPLSVAPEEVADQSPRVSEGKQSASAVTSNVSASKSSADLPPESAVEPLTDDSVEKTKEVKLPSPSTKVAVAYVKNYRVVAGDTLSAIARAHGVSQQDLIRANRIANPNLIRVNQTLVIPTRVAAASTLPELPVTVIPASEPEESAANTQEPINGSLLSYRVQPAPGAIPPESPDFTPSDVRPRSVEPAPGATYDYVGNLRAEIVKLREKYRSQASPTTVQVNQTEQVAAVSANPAPELIPQRVDRVNPELRPVGERVAPRSPVNPEWGQSEQTQGINRPQQVAVAPVGSESYDPILSAAIGKVVSPDLPPIGTPDSYLPNGRPASQGFIWPTRGVLTSGYGWRWGRMHRGIDIAAPTGTPIVAAADGVVTYSRWNSGGYGYLVEITHPDGAVTLYAHNSRLLVREGQLVTQGQQVAEMGSTGYSTGPHCHFEIHLPGQGAINPVTRLARRLD